MVTIHFGNNRLKPCMNSLVQLFRSLVFVVLERITRFSFASIKKLYSLSGVLVQLQEKMFKKLVTKSQIY